MCSPLRMPHWSELACCSPISHSQSRHSSLLPAMISIKYVTTSSICLCSVSLQLHATGNKLAVKPNQPNLTRQVAVSHSARHSPLWVLTHTVHAWALKRRVDELLAESLLDSRQFCISTSCRQGCSATCMQRALYCQACMLPGDSSTFLVPAILQQMFVAALTCSTHVDIF